GTGSRRKQAASLGWAPASSWRRSRGPLVALVVANRRGKLERRLEQGPESKRRTLMAHLATVMVRIATLRRNAPRLRRTGRSVGAAGTCAGGPGSVIGAQRVERVA